MALPPIIVHSCHSHHPGYLHKVHTNKVIDVPAGSSQLVHADVDSIGKGGCLQLDVATPGSSLLHAPHILVEWLVILDEGLEHLTIGLQEGTHMSPHLQVTSCC